MSKDASSTYFHRLHALDLTTGAEKFGGPMDIQAVFPGTGDNSNGTNVVFDPKQYEERAALLLLNGVVYTSWTSHCDIGLYTGWVIGYAATTLARTSVFNFTPNGHMGSVWMAGSGPAADPNGNIYFLASNGTFDTTLDTSGFPNRGNFGNAFMKLSTINNTLGRRRLLQYVQHSFGIQRGSGSGFWRRAGTSGYDRCVRDDPASGRGSR